MLTEMSKSRRCSERLKAFDTNSLSDPTQNSCENPPEIPVLRTVSLPFSTGMGKEDEGSRRQPPTKRHKKQQKTVCQVSSEDMRMLPTKAKKGRRKTVKQEPDLDSIECQDVLLPLPDSPPDVLTPFTSIEDDDDDDDDDALPRFDFVPDEMFKEGDLIWVKLLRDPYWPAVALKLMKRRQRLQRVRFRFIEYDENNKLMHKPLTLNYNSTRIQPISKDYETHKSSEMTDDMSKRFKKTIERVEKFLFSCSQPRLKAVDYFAAAEESPVNTESGMGDGGESPYEDTFQVSLTSNGGSDGACEGIKSGCELEEDEQRKVMIDVADDDAPLNDKQLRLSGDTYRRITERQIQEQELVDLIKNSDKVKAHLRDVLSGETKSTYHLRFHKPGKTRAEDRALKTLGFGPIENESHIAEITKFLQRHLCTMKGLPKQDDDIYYLTDVWFPEATIFAIHLQRNVGLEEAERIFAHGIEYTPEEMAVFTDELIANTTDEDRAEQRARMRRFLNNGLDVV